MWSYYGAKTNIVHLYPKPKHDKIIEPFAGSARYALRYFEKDILLVDKYEVIVKIWKWLQLCSAGDIKKIPRLKHKDKINDISYGCEEERLLMGFVCGFGNTNPRKSASVRLKNRPNAMNYTLNQIEKNLFKIRHWKIIHGSFEDIANERATWFIDPPYQKGGQHYIKSNKDIDFTNLAQWSMERQGQVIVCETMTADWLPFVPIGRHKTRTGWQPEGIWTNEKTAYNNTQQEFGFAQ